jgi:hypothetical protein
LAWRDLLVTYFYHRIKAQQSLNPASSFYIIWKTMELDSERLDSEDNAQRNWFYRFQREPYTSFWMIDDLINRANVKILKAPKCKGYSYEDFINNPKSLKQVLSEAEIQSSDLGSFTHVLLKPGRCTSFAIQTASEIAAWRRRDFDFKFCDLGRHRVARCSKTGLLIDSSSSVGAFILREGQWKSFDNQTRWKWSSETSKFEMVYRRGETVPVSIHDLA